MHGATSTGIRASARLSHSLFRVHAHRALFSASPLQFKRRSPHGVSAEVSSCRPPSGAAGPEFISSLPLHMVPSVDSINFELRRAWFAVTPFPCRGLSWPKWPIGATAFLFQRNIRKVERLLPKRFRIVDAIFLPSLSDQLPVRRANNGAINPSRGRGKSANCVVVELLVESGTSSSALQKFFVAASTVSRRAVPAASGVSQGRLVEFCFLGIFLFCRIIFSPVDSLSHQ